MLVVRPVYDCVGATLRFLADLQWQMMDKEGRIYG